MKKTDLLNFAKGMNPGAKSTIIIYYYIGEKNDIVIDDTGFKENPKGTDLKTDFQYIKRGEGDFTPSDKDIYETWFAFQLEKIKPK
jgi:hypothetical protein